jgi:large subunit ribosomal protein L21
MHSLEVNELYAIIETGGMQFRVEQGTRLNVPLMQAETGSTVRIDRVLLLDAEGSVSVGAPLIEGAFAEAEVLEHGRGDKIVVFKRKRRKGFEKTQGHRQDYTRIEIKTLSKG